MSVISAIVALAGLFGAGAAYGDGDPASDVLVSQSMFVPIELSINRQTEQLQALLAEAARAGFKVRVAMIDSPRDLGTVTSLWRQPKLYSGYLGTELSLSFTGQVVVVMPNGIGVYPGRVAPTPSERTVAAELPAPGPGEGLVTGAIAAVERLAAAQGDPLATAGIRAPAGAPASGGAPTSTWLALGLGALLIALAWAASLRARPLGLGRRATA